MGDMPTHDIVITNKDKSLRKYVGWDGKDRESQYQQIGRAWAKEGDRFKLNISAAFEYDPNKHEIILFVARGGKGPRAEKHNDGLDD